MDTTAAAELAASGGMMQPIPIMSGPWMAGDGDDQAAWSDEDFTPDDSDNSKPRRHHHNHHHHDNNNNNNNRHARLPPEKRARSDGYSRHSSGSGSDGSGQDQRGLSPDNFDYQPSKPGSCVNTGGTLQKQGSMRGSNSFSGELGSTVADSASLAGNGGGASGGASASSANTGKSKGTGSIFFKTKLCCKFRAGICPYNSNCNFAHGMEELRKPPPGWEEVVAAQEAERALRNSSRDNRDSQGQSSLDQSGSGGGGGGDGQRFHKTPRPCRKFYTEEGCPYGDRCIFLHDDQGSQGRVLRESNAISLGPTSGQVNSGTTNSSNANDRSANWKTRVCNKWETTGHCPFGQKCHFVHGTSEGSSSVLNSKYGGNAPALQSQRPAPKTNLKWKGPADEISTIYGDWIEEDEWEISYVNVMA